MHFPFTIIAKVAQTANAPHIVLPAIEVPRQPVSLTPRSVPVCRRF
jgi:hypothetical protein